MAISDSAISTALSAYLTRYLARSRRYLSRFNFDDRDGRDRVELGEVGVEMFAVARPGR